ncbi:MAG TPA: PDZ domain-containing protein, partial [Anaerolineaceae bacterium]
MKRVYIIGIVGAALVSLAGAAIVLALLVTPVRAQIARTIGTALNNRGSLLLQGQTTQMKDEKGVLVAGIFTGSPADKAGLVRGDILLQVDGQDINTRQDLNGILAKHKVGDSLKILVQHGDTQKTVTVTLAEPPAATSTAPNGQQPQTTQKNPFLGIVPIGAGEFRGGFGRSGKFGPGMGQSQAGAVIMQVSTGSPAEKAGLKVGEIITSVNGTAIDA